MRRNVIQGTSDTRESHEGNGDGEKHPRMISDNMRIMTTTIWILASRKGDTTQGQGE